MDTYSLASVLRRPSRFSHLSSRRHMLLPGTTVTNLELYANATDGRTRGSLLWILDRTKTVMGRRLLRDWIGRPLVDIAELRLRQSTVAELASSTSWQAGKLKNLVMGLPDLEKGLVRIHYGKCTPAELVRILDALHRVSSEYEAFGSPEDVGFESAQLNEIVFALPLIRPTVERYLALVDPSAAREGRKEDMFRDEEENVPDIVDCKDVRPFLRTSGSADTGAVRCGGRRRDRCPLARVPKAARQAGAQLHHGRSRRAPARDCPSSRSWTRSMLTSGQSPSPSRKRCRPTGSRSTARRVRPCPLEADER